MAVDRRRQSRWCFLVLVGLVWLIVPAAAAAQAASSMPNGTAASSTIYDYDAEPNDAQLVRDEGVVNADRITRGSELRVAPSTTGDVYDLAVSSVAPSSPGSGFANWGDEISDGARMVDQPLVDSGPPGPYSRPSGATTPAQRASVQGEPCVVCSTVDDVQVADHIYPLVQEWYETGAIDLARMREVTSVQPMCVTCSASQGGSLSWWSRGMREQFGFG